MATRAVDPIAYFWRHVDKRGVDECWPWTGACTPGGYGDMPITLAPCRGAHRFSWMLHAERAVPTGLVVRHACDSPGCVNPAHLSIGTQADNIRDKVERGRGAAGERNGMARLTDGQYHQIEPRVRAGERQVDLAEEFGVSPQAICQYLKRRRELTSP